MNGEESRKEEGMIQQSSVNISQLNMTISK